MTTRFAVVLSLVAAFGSAAPSFAAQSALAESRRILLAFDAAWNSRDVDSMMANVSAKFGCNFYGGIGAEQLKRSFAKMLEALPNSRCVTRVERIVEQPGGIQAYVRREFFVEPASPAAADASSSGTRPSDAIETQCQIIYLQRVDGALQIVALEDYDPNALDGIAKDRFIDPRTGLSLRLPEGMFVVAAPRFSSLNRLVLRSDDLHGEILVSLDLFPESFELEPAFDHDLRDWEKRTNDGSADRRGPATIAGYPGYRASGSYRGGACSLRPEEPGEAQPRSFTRIYVQPDPAVLLAILFDADRRVAERLVPKLDALVASIELAAAPKRSYGDALRERLGFGPIPGGVFRCADSGFVITCPPDFTAERVPTAGCFRLLLRRASDSLKISLEASLMLDPDCDPGEIAEDDDEAFLDAVRTSAGPEVRVGHSRVQLGTLDWLRADRAVGSRSDPAGARSEFTFYSVCRPYMLTAEVRGGRDEASTRSALENVLRGIRRIE